VIDHSRRLQLADELLRRFASALRGAQLYSGTHPLVGRNMAAFAETIALAMGHERSIVLGVVGGEFVVGDVPLPRSSATMADLLNRLQRAGVERITIDRDVTQQEIAQLVQSLADIDGRGGTSREASLLQLPHIQIGRITLEQRIDATPSDMATIRKLYSEATTVAGQIWETAQSEGRPDPAAARSMVDTLAQAVAQNRTALLALTALKNYDNYTFTHMVNVSILTMGQARALGIDGARLREFGLAGLMHDIGKVRTPAEILNKPDVLTEQEFVIMRHHVVDGAEILRRTAEVPPIAPIVAFEHHLRADGSGYPAGVTRRPLNLATVLCGIADVYDAMRSQRSYQQASPTDRILAVLQKNDHQQFDQHLVRRFSQLLGIYPPGNLVRLDTGEIGVVVRVFAPDPHRPRVRVTHGRNRERLERPYDVNLWETQGSGEWPSAVEAPVDPRDYDIDPLALL
jgi:putative nucleotidyltransferase with HDIG domain